MSKSKPQINGAIRFGGQVFKTGDEEAFEKAVMASLDKDAGTKMIKRLVAKGTIGGLEISSDDSEDSDKAPTGRNLGSKKPAEKAVDSKESKETEDSDKAPGE